LIIGNGATGSLNGTTGTALTFNAGGGVIDFRRAASSTQGMGALTFSAGDGSIISTAASGASTATLTFASLANRAAGATGNLSLATNTTAGQNKIVLTSTTNAPVSGSGSNNQGYFFGGTEYVRYDTVNGYFRAASYGADNNAAALVSGADIGATTSATDVKLSGNITGQTAGSVNTINLGANNFAFDNAGVTLSVNGILSAGTASAAISNGTNASSIRTTTAAGELVVRVNSASDALTIAPDILNNGGSSFTKSGAGTLTLSGANTYTGVTTINAGTLALSGGSAITDSGSVVLVNAAGATLRLDSSETIANLSGGGFSGGNVNVQGNNLTLNMTGNQTFGGTFSGTGSSELTKTGNNTLTLNNANSFAGVINLNAGALTLAYGNTGISLQQTISSGGAINMAGGTSISVTPTPQVAVGQQNSNTPAQLNVANSGFVIGNAINITSGTATLNLGGNDNRVIYNGNITGGTTGNQILKVNSLSSNQAYQFTGVVQNGVGGNLGVTADATGTAAATNPHFFNFAGQNTFTGPIVVNNTTLSTGGVFFVIGGLRTATGLTTGSGYLGGGNYSSNIALSLGTILEYASSANQNLGGIISGVGSLQKNGAGNLTLTNSNTYLGSTNVITGVLQLEGTLAGNGSLNISGGTFNLNRAVTTTQGIDISAGIGGTASSTSLLANIGAGTLVLNAPTFHSGTTKATTGGITLSHKLALQNSALDTAGAGTVTLSGGVTTPTFGGFTGSANLSSYLVNYGNVTALTLNPQTGLSYTYTGVIANGAAGMSLTKNGTGTQILQNANTYSGATTINAGTLTLSGTSGALANTSGITINSGASLTLTNAVGESAVNRLNDSAGISVNGGGNITWINPSGDSTADWSETLAAITVNSGQLNVISTNAVNAVKTQVLTLGSGSLGHTSATDRSVFTFSGTSLGSSTTNNIVITGQANTAANQIIGSWATFGTAANAQSDYATYNITGGAANTRGIQAAGIAGSAQTAWTTAADAYTNSLAAQTLTGTRTINALRNTGTTATLTLASGFNLETYGVLNGAGTLFTIAPGTGGVLTTPTGGGNLYLTTGSNAIAVSSIVTDNSGAVTLVKSGTGGTLTMSNNNTFTGGIVLNSGTLLLSATQSFTGGVTINSGNLGDNSTNLTPGGLNGNAIAVNGNAFIGSQNTVTAYTGNVTINNGAMLTLANNNGSSTWSGQFTGTGGIVVGQLGLGSNTINLTNTSNSFTGGIDYTNSINGTAAVSVNSFSDSLSAGAGNIRFGLSGGSIHRFELGSGAITGLTLNNRHFDIAGTANTAIQINNQSGQTFTINSDLLASGSGIRTLSLGGAGLGLSNFAGKISNGNLAALGLTKADSGSWVISGVNTYSGNTTISAGTLTIGGSGVLGGGSYTGNISIASTSLGNLTYNSSANQTFSGVISGAGALNKSNSGTLILDNASNSLSGVTTVTGGTLLATQAAALSGYNVASKIVFNGGTVAARVGGAGWTTTQVDTLLTGATKTSGSLGIDTTNGSLTQWTAFTTTNLGSSLGLAKLGSNTLILDQTNTYTGATTVSTGTLVVNGSISTSSLTTVATGATIGGSGTIGALTVSSGGFINPGNSPGILSVSGAYTQAGLFTAEINGLTAGTEHDQINVTGSVDISGGSLAASFSAGTYAANDLIFILLNDGSDAITGTYSGLAQGATVTSYGGFNWNISYVANSGGSPSFTGGNDIALMAEAIPEPKTALLGVLGVLLLLRRRR